MRCGNFLFSPRCASSPSSGGWTLVEILIALSVGFIILASAGGVLLMHLQTTARLELAQRQRDNSVRLDYLMHVEASEAGSVSDSQNVATGCVGAGQEAFATFVVPRDEGPYQDPGNVSLIQYYNRDGDVWRCGPPVSRNGVLDHYSALGPQSGVAVRDATLQEPRDAVTDEAVPCNGLTTSERQLVYRLVFDEAVYTPACSIARVRTVRID